MVRPLRVLRTQLQKSKAGRKVVQALEIPVPAGVLLSAFLIAAIPSGILYVQLDNFRSQESKEESLERIEHEYDVDVDAWGTESTVYAQCMAAVEARDQLRDLTLYEYNTYARAFPSIGFIWLDPANGLISQLDENIPAREPSLCKNPGPRPQPPQDLIDSGNLND